MNDLEAITRVLFGYNLKKNQSLLKVLFPSNAQGKEYELVQLLLKSHYQDETIEKELVDWPANVKSRVKKKLESGLLNFYYEDESMLEVSKTDRILAKSKLSFQAKQYGLAISFCKEGLKTTKKNQQTSQAIDFLNILYSCYIQKNLLSEAAKTNKEIIKYNGIHLLENEAKSLYQHIEINLLKSRKTRIETLDLLDDYLQRIDEIAKEVNTVLIYTIQYKIQVLKYKAGDQNEKLLEFLRETDERMIYSPSAIGDFEFQTHIINKSEALLKSERLNEGISYVDNNIGKFNKSTREWFEIQLIYLLMHIHNKDYSTAEMVINQIRLNPSYQHMHDDIISYFRLCKAYLYFAQPGKKISNYLSLDEIYNDFPGFSKDKLGQNCHLLLIEFLYYVESYKTETALDRKESLQNYLYKNLKNSSANQREVILFKLIMISIETNFNYDKSKEKGEALIQRLISMKRNFISYQDAEIIPYEHLWGLLLIKMLKKNTYY